MLLTTITKVDRRVATILIEKEVSLSEIARESNTTKANVFNSLKRLKEKDLVRKVVRGRTHIYNFNYLNPQAKELIKHFLEEKKSQYNAKMNGLPKLLNLLLENMLGEKYQGCIFFGSSLRGKYNDIDIFILADETKEKVLKIKVKEVNQNTSLIIGTKEELEKGAKEENMLYKNIIKGVPFGCEDFILELRQWQFFLRRRDITERFILGYREVLSCFEFNEKSYLKRHLKKGTMDVAYAVLNYFDLFPKDDQQASIMFKDKFGFVFSRNITMAKKQVEKLGGLIL